MEQRETHRAHEAGHESLVCPAGECLTGFQQPKGDQTMSGIWIEAHGEVEKRETERYDAEHSGYTASASLTRTAQEEVEIEFNDGTYVNLEGYAQSYSDFSVEEILSLNRLFPDWEPVYGTWTIEIHGTAQAWIDQAERYLDERPEMDMEEALRLFRSWDETDTSRLDSALEKLKEEEN